MALFAAFPLRSVGTPIAADGTARLSVASSSRLLTALQTLPRSQHALSVRGFRSQRPSSTSATVVAPSEGLLAQVVGMWRTYPLAFTLTLATVQTSVADLMTQTLIERHPVDWRRHLVFVSFGALYLGGFQYWLQVTMFRRLFPGMDRVASLSVLEKLRDAQAVRLIAKQVAFDICIHLPFMYYPTFYVMKEFVLGNSWAPSDFVGNGLHKYWHNCTTDVARMTSVFLPADIVLFSIPIWLRLPLRQVVSFCWTSWLSFSRGSAVPKKYQHP
eukprot:EG_transcript_21116